MLALPHWLNFLVTFLYLFSVSFLFHAGILTPMRGQNPQVQFAPVSGILPLPFYLFGTREVDVEWPRHNAIQIFQFDDIVYYFPSKIFFESLVFNSVVGVFFLFLKLPMTQRLRVCRVVGDLHNTYV